MKLNSIISKFFALAAAVMVVAACSEDPTEDITGGGKPTPPVGDGENYFNFEVATEGDLLKEIGDYEYVASIGETLKFSDLSEAALSHEWQLSSSEGMEFMLADGTAIDPAAVDVSFDEEVYVRFTQAGNYKVTLVNRYADNVTYTYPPEPADSPTIQNGTQIGDSGYYQMEWDIDVLVYSEEFSSLSANFYSNSSFSTPTEAWSPEERSLYIRDDTEYSKDAERPTKYTWSCTSHTSDYVTFSDQKDEEGTVKVLFNSATENLHIRMTVERDAGDEDSGWLPAISSKNYDGLAYVEVGELDKSDLIISSITPYDPDGVGSTNQIELTLDSDDKGTFDSELLGDSDGYSKFRLNYYDNTNNQSGTALVGEAWEVSTSKSIIVTLSGYIYTNDTEIDVTLSDTIADIDLYEERDLTVNAVASAGDDIAYEPYNLLPAEEFDFSTMDSISDNWWFTGSASSTLGDFELVDDPFGSSEQVFAVHYTCRANNNTSGHKHFKNVTNLNLDEGSYNISFDWTVGPTPTLCLGNSTFKTFTMSFVNTTSNYLGNDFVKGLTGDTSQTSGASSLLPWFSVSASSSADDYLVNTVHSEWQTASVSNVYGYAMSTCYMSIWTEYISAGYLYFKNFKVMKANDRPAN